MNDTLTDEAYARAALTYLAEPTDRWLGRLLRVHRAATVLDAIRAPGSPAEALPPLAGPSGSEGGTDTGTDPGLPHGRAREAIRAAMERWRTRLPELPTPEEVLAFRKSGIRLVVPGDPEWPGQLADLGDNQPYALWLRGNADLRFSCLRSVAIVGSRAATAYGCYVAAEFAASVAARGLAVVSGGAFGVDASAHRGALGADGVTVAVLACGVDVPYPTAHTELFDAIAGQGVIASEWPPGRPVSRLRFLVRNRVIAALATGTLVVEASQRSGAVNTARHARDLRRRLMAVPGPVTSDLSAGCHQVIREWQATLVTSAVEVVEHLSPVGALPPDERGDEASTAAETGAGARSPGRRRAPAVLPRDLLDLESATVLDAMPSRGGMGTVRVAQRAGLAPATTAALLGQLAAGGFIERCDEGWRLRRFPPGERPPDVRPGWA
ncbi:MAG TPA: DNA-processing protein DprA [Trebonia sp.]